MNALLHRLEQIVLPPNVRRFTTFRVISTVVVLLSIAALIVRLVVKLPPDIWRTYHHADQLVASPAFLVPFNIMLAFGFGIVFATRRNARYYVPRVLLFGMLLAAAIAELLILLVPFKAA